MSRTPPQPVWHSAPSSTDLDDATQDSSWRDYGHDDLPAILGSALECFISQGYHGTTIREVAAHAGLSVPGLYYHYASKHALLVALMSHAMSDLWRRSEQALAEAGDSVSRRFDLLIECMVLFHARRRELAFIAFSEIRSLDAEARAEHIAARDRQQRLIEDVVRDGARGGEFATPFPREVSTALITMCTGVAQWFHPGGALSPEDLAQRYRRIARMTVGAAPGA